jgi:hypothetical protein
LIFSNEEEKWGLGLVQVNSVVLSFASMNHLLPKPLLPKPLLLLLVAISMEKHWERCNLHIHRIHHNVRIQHCCFREK